MWGAGCRLLLHHKVSEWGQKQQSSSVFCPYVACHMGAPWLHPTFAPQPHVTWVHHDSIPLSAVHQKSSSRGPFVCSWVLLSLIAKARLGPRWVRTLSWQLVTRARAKEQLVMVNPPVTRIKKTDGRASKHFNALLYRCMLIKP